MIRAYWPEPRKVVMSYMQAWHKLLVSEIQAASAQSGAQFTFQALLKRQEELAKIQEI